jgi:hypothetical protein
MQTATDKTKRWNKAKAIFYWPFEQPNAATLVYAFFAGILASLAASLFTIPPLEPTPPLCTSVLLLSASLLAISSGMMVWISFELEAFKEDLSVITKGGLPLDKQTRHLVLEKGGVQQNGEEPPQKRFNRLWRLWILLAVSCVSAIVATILVWTN